MDENQEINVDNEVEDDSSNDKTKDVTEENELNDKDIIEENKSLKNSLAVLQADFINFKNRIEKDKSQSILLANEGLIMKLLPVLDDLERAYEHSNSDDEFSQGIKNIIDNFKEILKKEGLEEIKSDNTIFDHNIHQAILLEKSDSVESGYIIETFQKGYILNKKVIRPSMVKVSE